MNALKGILIALVAACVYAILIFGPSVMQDSSGAILIFVVVGSALLNTCWFVVPAGAILGILIPKMVSGLSPAEATVRGILLAIIFGLIGSILLSLYFDVLPLLQPGNQIVNHGLWWTAFWKRTASQGILMGIYSAIWIGSYARYCAKQLLLTG